MFEHKGFVFDANLCLGCRSCEMACRNENHTPPLIHWRRVKQIGIGTYLSMSCNHCENPECFRICPQQAFTKRNDGIVQIDSSRCDGCKYCVDACPYGAPQYNPETNKVTRCQMCYPRQDAGLLPACVEACTTGALQIMDLNQCDLTQTVPSLPGFSNINLTRPSIRFYQLKNPKYYFFKK